MQFSQWIVLEIVRERGCLLLVVPVATPWVSSEGDRTFGSTLPRPFTQNANSLSHFTAPTQVWQSLWTRPQASHPYWCPDSLWTFNPSDYQLQLTLILVSCLPGECPPALANAVQANYLVDCHYAFPNKIWTSALERWPPFQICPSWDILLSSTSALTSFIFYLLLIGLYNLYIKCSLFKSMCDLSSNRSQTDMLNKHQLHVIQCSRNEQDKWGTCFYGPYILQRLTKT